MDMKTFYSCMRVLAALQCLELAWSYSILIDTLKNDQQIENSLTSLIQTQIIQNRHRRQAPDPQTDIVDPNLGHDLGTGEGQPHDGAMDGSHSDGVTQGPGTGMDSGDSQNLGSDPQPDSSADPSHSSHGDQPGSDQSHLEGQDPSISADQPTDPVQPDSGNLDSGSNTEGASSSDQSSEQHPQGHEHVESTPANLRGNWQYPTNLRGNWQYPYPTMTSVYRGDAPLALPMTGHQGQGYNVPEQGQGDSSSADHSSMDSHGMMDSHGSEPHSPDPQYSDPHGEASSHSSDTGGGEASSVDTVPLEGHEGHPKALPHQQQQQPWFQAQRQPMAMPQKQGQGGNQRPPPNWGNKNNQQGQGRPRPRAGPGQGPGMPMGPGMNPGSMGMTHGGNPMERMAQMNMMKAQSELMQDQMEGQQDMYRNMYNPYARFDPRYNPQYLQNNGNMPKGQYGSYPFPPYNYGDSEGFEGFPGYNLDINTGFPPCTNMSDLMCKQRMMAQREIQIETPYGEMDMEPGEMDLEGAAAHQLLKQIGIGGPGMNPHMQEINLNKNVLDALKRRFGVNTTAGIRRMSGNREFQAFMYRVLTHSAPVAPGEYNANLTQAEVNWIMNDLGASTANHRLTTGNLDHAKLNMSSSPNKQSVLTINGGQNMAPNPWGQMGPGMGMFPFADKQVQDPSMAGNQPGIVQALVQGMLGGEGGEPAEGITGGEAKEAEEKKKTNGTATGTQGEAGELAEAGKTNANGTQVTGTQTNGTKTTQILGTQVDPTASTGLMAAITNLASSGQQPNQGTGANVQTSGNNPATLTETAVTGNGQQGLTGNGQPGLTANGQPGLIGNGQPGLTQSTGKEKDIIGKDGKFGLSKDQRTQLENSLANQGGIAGGVNTGTQNNMNNMIPAENSIPIGIKEAGLETASVTNTTLEPPVEAIPAGYASSTAFAIAAISMIILAIIVGPILCYLCKLKEKREQKMRKQKAMKNREVSENNIMESMVLHDFGQDAPNSVGNDGASPYGERYTALDSDIAEIEQYKKAGYLP